MASAVDLVDTLINLFENINVQSNITSSKASQSTQCVNQFCLKSLYFVLSILISMFLSVGKLDTFTAPNNLSSTSTSASVPASAETSNVNHVQNKFNTTIVNVNGSMANPAATLSAKTADAESTAVTSSGVSGLSDQLAEKQIKYFSPRQIAEVFDRLLLKLKNPLLNNHRSLIRSIIIQNEVNSIKIGCLKMNNIYDYMAGLEKQVRAPRLRDAIWKAIGIMQKYVLKSGGLFMNWDRVVNAISHDMGHVVAQNVDSVTPELGKVSCITADAFISKIQNKMQKKLTNSEAVHLKDIFQRATALHMLPSSVQSALIVHVHVN